MELQATHRRETESPVQRLTSIKKTCDESLRRAFVDVSSILGYPFATESKAESNGRHPAPDEVIESAGEGPRSCPPPGWSPRTLQQTSTATCDYDVLTSFILHDILFICCKITSTSLERFLAKPAVCEKVVNKLRDLGKSWQEHPQWSQKDCFARVLLAISAFSRALKWYQAVQHSEDIALANDGTEWGFRVSKWSGDTRHGQLRLGDDSSPTRNRRQEITGIAALEFGRSHYVSRDSLAETAPQSIKEFNIIRTLSRSTHTAVFIANRGSTLDMFAVKVIEKSAMFAKNKITLIRANRMAIHNQLDSYFVNKIHFTFQSKSNVYIVKELLRKGDCATLINSLGRVGEDVARDYIFQIVQGLQHLHQEGIVHRDLRPENILIDEGHRLKLTDFGLSQKAFLSRNIGSILTKEFARTVYYLTPEAILGVQDDDSCIDWWALGVIAHEFLCGSTPFKSGELGSDFLKILAGKIDWKWETAPSLAARRLIEALLRPVAGSRCSVRGAKGIVALEFFSRSPPGPSRSSAQQNATETDWFGKGFMAYLAPQSPTLPPSPSSSRSDNYLGTSRTGKGSPILLPTSWRQSSQESSLGSVPRRHRSRSARSRSRPRNSSRTSSYGSSWLSGYTTTDSDHESEASFVSTGRSTRSSEWRFRASEFNPVLHGESLDLTDRVSELDRYPFESGNVADIYKGVLISTRSLVAIKIFRRMHSERETMESTSKYLYQEARIWQQLKHPNILPFLGISLNLGRSPALISPLCVSGPIMKYLQHINKDSQGKLRMAMGVAEGLAYLHSQGIVHGNLCTKKVLIDAKGSPVICGYGMSKALRQPAHTTHLFLSPTRFASPESFFAKGGSSVRTESGDVYSFSMVVLEIISGLPPYHDLPNEQAVFLHVVRGGRPSRTREVTNGIYRFLQSVWNECPSSRPKMREIIQGLTSLADEQGSTSVQRDDESLAIQRNSSSSSGSEASPSLGDIALPEFNGRDLRGRVAQDDQYPFAGGANSNIYRGILTRSNGRKIRVAIKMLRVSDDGSGQLEEIMKRLKREVDLWAGLGHKNVLPFFGVCDDIAPWPVLISPFYKLGHVGTYVRSNPSTNRGELACGVASGLKYLHAKDIVHGDLKVQNVLVDKRGAPCICDFGISKIIGHRGYTTSSVGTAPYMAPELFFVLDGPSALEQASTSPSTSKSSDVYSFALLVLEILTSEPPKGRPSRPIVTTEILNDLRPKRSDYDQEKVKKETWSVLDLCWTSNPDQRPEIIEVHRDLASSLQTAKLPLAKKQDKLAQEQMYYSIRSG